jgi:hypothetical protein
MSCDITGLTCEERARQSGYYTVQSKDRGRRLKAIVTLRNPSGPAGAETKLSPIITG